MKRLIFYLAALCCASCVDAKETPREEEGPEEIVYLPTDTFVSTYAAEWLLAYEQPLYETIKGFYLVVGFHSTDACNLTQESYAWFEVLSYNDLRFIDEYADSEGVLHLTEAMQLLDYVPWQPNAIPAYDYYRLLPTSASAEGEYIFRLKFYQPGTGKYYTTSSYRIKLWSKGDGYLWSEVELV